MNAASISAQSAAGIALTLALGLLGGCGTASTQPISASSGPRPLLPAPISRLLPTVNIAPARGWPAGGKPDAADGLQVAAFAEGLEHPRWLLVLPNGDVLVAETNAPEKARGGGLRGWIATRLMARAGAGGASPDRISLLRDADGDGRAELKTVFLSGLHSPFGMALVGDQLYVANTDAVLRFRYATGATTLDRGSGQLLTELPAGPINHHWTKNLIASGDGSKLYATVGSNSNVAENGLDAETGRAAIWEIDLPGGSHRIYASGLRNPNGLAWPAGGDQLWTVVNERDELGNDLVPDYLTSVTDGGFYGWPYSYFGDHLDLRVQPMRPELVATARVPDYALGAHTASLGLAAATGTALPERLRSGLFIGQHGSWNRKPHSGYRVIFVPFADGQPAGAAIDVLDGFLDAQGKAYGRPVGVAMDRTGAVLVADDVGNTVWRVTASR